MSWKPRAGSYLTCNLLLPDNEGIIDLFDNYTGILLELDANPIAIAQREGLSFTSFTPINTKLKAISELSHDDDVQEVGWLPNGKICYIARNGEPAVDTGLPTEVLEYGETYNIVGPYTVQHELVWDVFTGLCSGRDVVLRLEDEPSRLTCSPLLPIIYAGLDALDVYYDARHIHPADILSLGWSRMLLLIPGASKVDLSKTLTHISPKMCEMLVGKVLKKREEDLVDFTDDPYGLNEMYGGM